MAPALKLGIPLWLEVSWLEVDEVGGLIMDGEEPFESSAFRSWPEE